MVTMSTSANRKMVSLQSGVADQMDKLEAKPKVNKTGLNGVEIVEALLERRERLEKFDSERLNRVVTKRI